VRAYGRIIFHLSFDSFHLPLCAGADHLSARDVFWATENKKARRRLCGIIGLLTSL
jgi:hypothetical protein